MIDKLDIASKNWADDYMTQFGRRFNNMLRDAFIAGFKKGVALSKQIVRCKDCEHYNNERSMYDDDYCSILYYCDGSHRTVCEQDFCSYGKRKEE